jgi:hypothetical protein
MGFRLLYSTHPACHRWPLFIPFFQSVPPWPRPLNIYAACVSTLADSVSCWGDATGALGLVEKTGLGTVVLPEQKKGAFVHANGIVDPVFAKQNPPQEDPIRTNSQQRYDNVLRQLSTGAGVEQILCDRSPRGAICQQGEDGMHTDFAAIFEPVEKKFRFWSGTAGAQTGEVVQVATIFGRT